MSTLQECLMLYARKGNHKEVIDCFEQIPQEFNEEHLGVINYHLGMGYFYNGDDEKAMQLLKQSIQRDLPISQLTNAYYLIGLLYDHNGDEERAIDCFTTAIEKSEFTFVGPLLNVCNILNGLNKHTEALNLISKFIQYNPKEKKLYELYLLQGDIYRDTGDFPLAIEAYSTASELIMYPFKPYYRMAGVYLLQKNKEKANYYFDLAATIKKETFLL